MTQKQRALLMTNLIEIQQRDAAVIPRLGDPDNDPLLRAEMDRRWLLGVIDGLLEGR